ncbi:major facilitator superfamily MFS_1 [Coraliomargarita akajimensis DSM 45221]|uniref:Major facilitator superfamily MFS_1 n=2 Tax=Coraliomargarita TaxID=442430 RepID=D5ELC3_CORAD|nr:major facilitator superfamily MFS_1 [Coraliomargarita akajimensis DSM 45221]
MMAVVMCLMFMPPGMWIPSLPNILEGYGAGWALPFAAALAPFGAIFSALFFGALSDRRVNAEQLLGVLGLTGAVFLWLGFSSLKWGWHPGWYLFFQGMNAVISGPMFALITKVKLVNLSNAEKSYPLYSMFGTLGWMSGGVLVSSLGFDASADAGQLAAYVRFFMGGLCFLLPQTPPTDQQSKGWKASLGLTAFGLLKDRELRVFYFASALFAIPCVSFYMIVPIMLKQFGSSAPSAQMALGQGVELLAMFALSLVAGRFRARWIVMLGFVLGLLRFSLFAMAGEFSLLPIIWLGIALHGPIYTFTMVAGRIFLDKRVPGTMRGQAQALYQLLVSSLAGVVGAFMCGWLYQTQISDVLGSWALYWWLLAAMTLVPLVYFWSGVRGEKPPVE